ncbi:NAD(P)-dependent dehydrogenase (short-subunit alcohol dehydrogenase family) [Nakamurella sp. UYEF19]
MTRVPTALGVLTGDFSKIADIRDVAVQANRLGTFDAVIHNAGVGFQEASLGNTVDGHSLVLSVNVLAPYLLTALMTPPKRLVYLGSGLHRSGDDGLHDVDWTSRPWNGFQAHNDSKLFDVALALAIARLRPATLSNALEPGWVAMRMGGAGAPDDWNLAHVTQAWLAVTDDPEATVSGRYFFHQRDTESHAAALDAAFQDHLLECLPRLTGVTMPGPALASRG